MLFPPRRELVQDPKFRAAFDVVVRKAPLLQAIGSIQEELAQSYGVSNHPAVDMRERQASRDQKLEGIRDFIQALLHFTDIEPEQKLTDYDWLDESSEKEPSDQQE